MSGSPSAPSFGLCSLIMTACLFTLGCGETVIQGPFGAPNRSVLLEPFAGGWTCDLEKTLQAQREAGVTDEVIEQQRRLLASNPAFSKIHPDLKINGDQAVGDDHSEYRFFRMHQHGDYVCGNAWHHEDRFDPGDMSKCYVQLKIKDQQLHLRVRMQEGLPDLNDPDLNSTPATEGGSSSECQAEKLQDPNWSGWAAYVFVRKP